MARAKKEIDRDTLLACLKQLESTKVYSSRSELFKDAVPTFGNVSWSCLQQRAESWNFFEGDNSLKTAKGIRGRPKGAVTTKTNWTNELKLAFSACGIDIKEISDILQLPSHTPDKLRQIGTAWSTLHENNLKVRINKDDGESK